MTDQRSEQTSPPPSPEKAPPKPFSLDVTIKNLPYIFAGTVPQLPSDSFAWRIHIPKWQEIAPLVSPDFRRSSQFDKFESTGEIGALYVDGTNESQRALYLSKIESNADFLPAGSPYHEARGIGGFLLNQLLALTDAKGLSVEAFIQAEGRLSNDVMNKWFEKKGFSHNEYGGGEFIRKPQQPDLTQPIVALLK